MKFQLKFNYLFCVLYLLLLSSFVYSLTSEKDYSSYRPNALCTPSSYMRYPKTEQDVVDIIEEAILTGKTVKAFGARHSQTDIICTEGIPVDSHGLKFYEMNTDGVTATFGAGVTLYECTEFLRKNGRGLKTTPAYGNITIAGAIGTSAHGSSIKYHSSISEQVVSVRIVDGTGEIQDISDPEDMKAFKCHLGLLGFIVRVTLQTEPIYKTHAHNYVVKDDILTNGVAIDIAKTTDQVSLYWFPTFGDVIVANWTIVNASERGNASTNDHVPSITSSFALIATTAKEFAFTLTSSTCQLASSIGYAALHIFEYLLELTLFVQVIDWVPIYSEDGFVLKNPAVGYYSDMFAPICSDTPQGLLGTACPWDHGPNNMTFLDNEFSMDLYQLPNFVKDIKDIVSKTPTAFPMQGILMRFSDSTDTYMSTAFGRVTVHFEFYMYNRKDTYNQPSGSLGGYQTILQLLQDKYNGRPHWGKNGLVYIDSDSLDKKLNRGARDNFIAVMEKYDPEGLFLNNFGRRLKEIGKDVDFDPFVTRCALLDNCFCKTNSNCGPKQICSTVPGYKYKVCKTPNEIAGPPFDKTKLPDQKGLLDFLGNTVGTLVTALTGNCSIDALVSALGYTTVNTLSAFLGGVIPTVRETLTSVGNVLKSDNPIREVVGPVLGAVNSVPSTLSGILQTLRR